MTDQGAKKMSEDGPPRCASCHAYFPRSPTDGECHGDTPKTAAVPMPKPQQLIAGQRPPAIQLQITPGYWPRTLIVGWCAKHQDFWAWVEANPESFAEWKRLAALPQEGEA